MRSDQVLGRTWGLRGKTPEVATSGRRQSVSAISAVNARGAFWYETYTERLNAGRFLELLKHFMRGRKRPVFLFLTATPRTPPRWWRSMFSVSRGAWSRISCQAMRPS